MNHRSQPRISSKRRQADESLTASELFYRTLIETIPHVVWLGRGDGQVTFLNRAWQELTGRSLPESLGWVWAEALHPDDVQMVLGKWERAYKYGEPYSGECRFRSRDGSYRLFSFVGTPVRDSSGKVVNWVGINTDITEWRRAEDALQESGARNRAILQTIPDMMFILDREGTFLDYSAPSLKALYTSPERFLGKSIREVLPSDLAKRVVPKFERALQTEKIQVLEYPLELQGRTRHFENRIMAYQQDKVMSIVREITDRKQAEEELRRAHRDLEQRVEERTRDLAKANEDLLLEIVERKQIENSLRESEERLRVVFDAAPIGIANLDDGGRFVRANSALHDMLGCDQEELLDRKFAEFCYAEDWQKWFELFENLRKGKLGSYSSESRYRRKDGALIWGRLTASAVRTGEGQFVHTVSMLEDITARKHSEEDRERMQQSLVQTQKLESLGVLAGGIAHDFNNLLTGMLGYAAMALEDLEANTPIRDNIEQVMLASKRAAELTRQMLTFSGRAKFEFQSINLSEHIREMTHLMKASISKKVSLDLQLQDHLPCIVADAAQIQQILMNLVINGAESCGDRPGKVVVTTRKVQLDEKQRNQLSVGKDLPLKVYACLEVRDNGCGMSDALKSKIFDPFFTTKFTGRGLGLSALLGIVRGHGGGLKVDSIPGEGTIFRILLPVAPESTRVPPAKRKPAEKGAGLILVVDDEPLVLGLARKILERCGYQVITAEDGRRGLKLFHKRAKDIDLVLLDMTMPDMNGEETLDAMRAVNPGVTAILSSGYSEAEASRRFSGRGLSGFVQKPYLPETLSEKVADVLRL